MTPTGGEVFEQWAERNNAKICNCAECRLPLTSDPRAIPLFRIGGRVLGRPYCRRCLGGKTRSRRAH